MRYFWLVLGLPAKNVHTKISEAKMYNPSVANIDITIFRKMEFVKMSDTDTGALLWSFGITSPYLGYIAEIFFSHDGRYVAVEYSDKVLRVLRVEDRIPSECYLCETAHVFIPLALRQCSGHWLYQHGRCIGA